MNRAFNHGSQGDLLTGIDEYENAAVKTVSKAPAGTGQEIRDSAREGNESKLKSLLSKWKNDPVVNEVRKRRSTSTKKLLSFQDYLEFRILHLFFL